MTRGILLSHALAVRGRRSVRDEEDVLNTHQAALIAFLLQEDNFIRDKHGVLCVRISCNRFMHNQGKGCGRGQILSTVISVLSAVRGSTKHAGERKISYWSAIRRRSDS
jgi:hypothetical protein